MIVEFMPTCKRERESAASQVSEVGEGSSVGVGDGCGTEVGVGGGIGVGVGVEICVAVGDGIGVVVDVSDDNVLVGDGRCNAVDVNELEDVSVGDGKGRGVAVVDGLVKEGVTGKKVAVTG